MPERLGPYAKGNRSWAVCDWCGLVYPYPDLRRQQYQITNLQNKVILQNLYVCVYDYDPDVTTRIVHTDPEALRHPRIDIPAPDPPPPPPYPVSAPTLSYTAGGSLPQTTYYVVTSYQFAAAQSGPASPEATITVPANNLLTVSSPPPWDIINAPFISTNPPFIQSTALSDSIGWNVYVSTNSGQEERQNTSILGFQFSGNTPVTTSWTQPNSGLIIGNAPNTPYDSALLSWDTEMTNTWSPYPNPTAMFPPWTGRTIITFMVDGTTATCYVPHHGYSIGNTIAVQYCINPIFNGIFQVTSVPSKDFFTYILNQSVEFAPTGGGQVTRLIVSPADY